MSQLTSLLVASRPREVALAISERLEQVIELEPVSVSIVETDESRDLWQVEAHYEMAPERGVIIALLTDFAIDEADLTIAPVITRDWISETLAGLKPVQAGRFYIHGAHDRHKRPASGISLEIDAGLAFGTGHHGTTQGCLLALEDIARIKYPRKVLDVGCGTGVLGLAAAHLTKRHVVLSDIDPLAIMVTLENAAKNYLRPLVNGVVASGMAHQTIRAGGAYDLIFANILARPLVKLAPQLTELLMVGGIVILSGLTITQEAWVMATYRAQGLILIARYRLENWSTLVMMS